MVLFFMQSVCFWANGLNEVIEVVNLLQTNTRTHLSPFSRVVGVSVYEACTLPHVQLNLLMQTDMQLLFPHKYIRKTRRKLI